MLLKNRFHVTFGLAGMALCTVAPAYAFANDDERQIVVTATPLSTTEKALADCIARNCPPDQEIRAALAHGENQFVAGKYRDAKSTLYKTVGRTRKFGDEYPIEVSDLFRARSRIAEHLGEPNDYQISVLDIRDVLRKGVGRDDPRALIAQIEVGDSREKLKYPEEAMRIYDAVSEEAKAKGEIRISQFARLRKNMLLYNFAIAKRLDSDKRSALIEIQKIADTENADAPDVKIMAEVALAKLERSIGRMDRTNAIIQKFALRDGATKPILLSSQPIKFAPKGNIVEGERDTREAAALGLNASRLGELSVVDGSDIKRFGIQFEGRWVDIGFWINANGNIENTEVLRSSGSTDGWLKPIVTSINSRIYAPLNTKKIASEGGIYMVERYTYTARYLDVSGETGTRIAKRGSKPRIEMINLTSENYDEFPATLPASKASGKKVTE